MSDETTGQDQQPEAEVTREVGGPVIAYTVIVLRQQVGPSEIGFQVLVRGNGQSPQEEKVMCRLVHDITGRMLGEERRIIATPMLPNLPPLLRRR